MATDRSCQCSRVDAWSGYRRTADAHGRRSREEKALHRYLAGDLQLSGTGVLSKTGLLRIWTPGRLSAETYPVLLPETAVLRVFCCITMARDDTCSPCAISRTR